MTEGWAETPGVHLELLEHSLLIVGRVYTPQDTDRLGFHCLMQSSKLYSRLCKWMKFLIK